MLGNRWGSALILVRTSWSEAPRTVGEHVSGFEQYDGTLHSLCRFTEEAQSLPRVELGCEGQTGSRGQGV